MSIKIVHGDICEYIERDAIVIPANPRPVIGNGVDKIIYGLAGKDKIIEERKNEGVLQFGEAVATSAGNLKAHIIIHAVSPAWDGGNLGEEELLRLCYVNALQCAVDNNCKSMVFPLLSTGVMKFPKEIAKLIAVTTIEDFLKTHDLDIILVLHDRNNISDELIENIKNYIISSDYSKLDVEEYWRCERKWADLPEDREERAALELLRKQYARKKFCERKYKKFLDSQKKWDDSSNSSVYNYSPGRLSYSTHITDINAFILNVPKRPSFTDVYNRFVRDKNLSELSDSAICLRGNLNSYSLTNLRKGKVGNSARDDLYALSIALTLDIDETEELFNSYGMSTYGDKKNTSNDMNRENCIRYFIENKIFDIHELNNALDLLGFKSLGNNSRI